MMDLIKKNVKFIVVMIFVIVLGIVGIAYAIKVSNFNPIALNVTTAPIDVNITYDSGANGANITSNGKMVPISDNLVTGVNVTDERVIKAKFRVNGVSSNPNNTIYDVALRDISAPCELRTEDVKWRLYKNGNLLSSGNLSPTFDVISDNRLVLTETQQDLTTTTDEYVFLMWISESCTGDISTCTSELDQSKYLNKSFGASIKIELSTKSKKTLVRNTGSANSCSFSTTSVPIFNTLTYTGGSQVLVNDGNGYTLINNTGTNASEYAVTAKLNDGYKWNDGTTDDKIIKGKINKKNATIVAINQSISQDSSIDPTKYTTFDLLSDHTVSSVFLETSTVKVGVGTITPTRASIVDASGNDVTDNYNINYVSGTLTVDCLSNSKITVSLPDNLTYGTSGVYTYSVSPTNLLVSCTSSDTSIATCSVDTSKKTITIVPKGVGSVNITLDGKVPNSNNECSSVSTSKAITINCSNTAIEPVVTSSQDYTGSIRIGVSGGANVDLGGTLSATNAGTYSGTATPKMGYCWSDRTNSTKSYNWMISKIADPITITPTTATYNGSVHPATAKAVSGADVKLTYYSDSSCSTKTNTTNATSIGGAPKNAGTYYVVGETSETSNYNSSTSSCTKAVTINKVTPKISLSATSGSVNYNATNTFTVTTKSPISSNVAGTLTAVSGNTTYVTITGGASSTITATSSGANTTITYKGVKATTSATAITVTFTPSDTTNFNSTTATYNVSKVSQLSGSISLSEKTATYTGSAIAANTATTNSGGTVTYTYYSDNSCSTKTATSTGASSQGAAPVDAGTYYVKATVGATDNYTSASTGCIKHTINKKSVSVTWGNTTTFTYNGSAQAPTATASSGITGETINLTRTTGTNAGSYTSTASCSGVSGGRAKCANYNLTNSTKAFTINKATPTISLSASSGSVNYNATNTFTATTKSPISSSVSGTLTASRGNYTYVTITGGASTSVTATSSGVNTTITYQGASAIASTVPITVTFTPTDTTNFNTATAVYSVTAVNKIASTCTISSVPTLKYPGTASGSISYSCTGDGTISLTSSNTGIITVGTVGNTSTTLTAKGIGSSTLTLKRDEGTNYLASSEVTRSISVSASTYTLTYNNNGGSGCSSKTVTYGSTYGTMCTPTRSGYIFIGWFDSNYKNSPLNYYADTYADLKNAFGYDTVGLYNHYLTYGQSEGRRISQYISTDTYNTGGNKTLYAGWVKFNYYRKHVNSSTCKSGYYNKLADAVCEGDEVTVLNDVIESSDVTFSGYESTAYWGGIKIFLNNHTITIPSITFNGNFYENGAAPGEAFITGPGTIKYSSSSPTNKSLLNVNSGVLYIKGGTYTSNNYANVIHVDSSGKLILDDTNNRIAIEADKNKDGTCPVGIYSENTDEFIVRARSKGIYIYANCHGINHAGVLRVFSTFPSGNNKGVEMSVIAKYGYAIWQANSNVQIGNWYCNTRDNCTSTEISEGKMGHYGYGTEMYPYLASYSATLNTSLFPVIWHPQGTGAYLYAGRLVTTKTGMSCSNVTAKTTSAGTCSAPFDVLGTLGRPSTYTTGFRWSSVSNETNSHGDNISGTKLMIYK